ncbi:uncharacterized protein EMH_0078840 [Eimeria mitis]|uniref:Uncharacterized protein n=1 Tax=Eimeria mitis TaxID=44415 RepID=U6K9S4_9EIME|nr:uncharacterized protein EMH_0078840 [Eimeria mitis]CDJ32942.1 hypothetical protein, conserved [Eimeria mitis]
MRFDGDALLGLSREELHARVLRQDACLKGLMAEAEKKEKETEKQIADMQREITHKLREEAKEALEAQAKAAVSLVETRSWELFEKQQQMKEWAADNEQKMLLLEERVDDMQQTAEEDPVIASVVASLRPLLPELEIHPVATPAAALAQLQTAVNRSARAAFVSEGSGVLSHLLGFVLGSLYTVLPSPPPFYSSLGSEVQTKQPQLQVVASNLEALHQARMHANRADLSSAVECMDRLKGAARRETAEEIKKIKMSLAVHRAVDTLHARLDCMNAQLAH